MELPPRDDLFEAALPSDEERMTLGGHRFDHRSEDYIERVSDAFSPDALARFDVSCEGALAVGDACPDAVLWDLDAGARTSLHQLLRDATQQRVVLNFGSYS
jgi:hypothetical protein